MSFKISRKSSALGLAAAAAITAIGYYFLYTGSAQKEEAQRVNFDELSDDEIKSWLEKSEISVPEDATRESLIILAKAA
jgi:spermidine/putrescine-binding protein